MAFNMRNLDDIYTRGNPLETWGKAHVPDQNLLYRSGVSDQLRKIGGVAAILPNSSQDTVWDPRIVGTHTSKSVKLPVTCFKFSPYGQVSAYAFIRDNFHDIKVVVVSDSPIHIPYSVMYDEWSPERYEAEVERYVGYTKNGRPAAGSYDWYRKDWSSGSLVCKDSRIYRTGSYQRVYCEGIDDLGLPATTFKAYEEGMKAFVCEVGSYATVATILEHVIRSLESERFKRNQ